LKQRFIIHIDDESGDFEIETPDGAIELENLLSILDNTIHTLIEANNEDLHEHYHELDDVEEPTPVEKFVSGDKEDKRKLN
jgi:hypothetical protein